MKRLLGSLALALFVSPLFGQDEGGGFTGGGFGGPGGGFGGDFGGAGQAGQGGARGGNQRLGQMLLQGNNTSDLVLAMIVDSLERNQAPALSKEQKKEVSAFLEKETKAARESMQAKLTASGLQTNNNRNNQQNRGQAQPGQIAQPGQVAQLGQLALPAQVALPGQAAQPGQPAQRGQEPQRGQNGQAQQNPQQNQQQNPQGQALQALFSGGATVSLCGPTGQPGQGLQDLVRALNTLNPNNANNAANGAGGGRGGQGGRAFPGGGDFPGGNALNGASCLTAVLPLVLGAAGNRGNAGNNNNNNNTRLQFESLVLRPGEDAFLATLVEMPSLKARQRFAIEKFRDEMIKQRGGVELLRIQMAEAGGALTPKQIPELQTVYDQTDQAKQKLRQDLQPRIMETLGIPVAATPQAQPPAPDQPSQAQQPAQQVQQIQTLIESLSKSKPVDDAKAAQFAKEVKAKADALDKDKELRLVSILTVSQRQAYLSVKRQQQQQQQDSLQQLLQQLQPR